MAQQTTRDELWKFAITRCHRFDGKMTAAELAEVANASERTARDVLKTMTAYDILREKRVGKTTHYVARPDAFLPTEDRVA